MICKRKLVEATITSSLKATDRQLFLRPPVKKTDYPGSSSPIQAISTPYTVVGPTCTGLNASLRRNVASISRPNPPSRPTRTGTPPKLALLPSYVSPKTGTANSISSSDSASAESSWSVIHGSNPRTSKLPRPSSKPPRKSALHRVQPFQKSGTNDTIPSMSPSEPFNSTLISPRSEPLETRNDNGDSESPWSHTHSSNTLTSTSPTDFLDFPSSISPSEPGNDNRDSESPWSVTQCSNDKQALNITFERAFSHNDRVNCVKFSKDGRYVAVGLSGGESNKWNGKAVVYNTETGMERWSVIYAHAYFIYSNFFVAVNW